MSSRLLDSLATTAPLADAFSDASLLSAMLQFETALARVEARLGIIPAAAAEHIEKAAHPRRVRSRLDCGARAIVRHDRHSSRRAAQGARARMGSGQRHVRPLGRDQPGRHRHGSRLVPRKGMAAPDGRSRRAGAGAAVAVERPCHHGDARADAAAAGSADHVRTEGCRMVCRNRPILDAAVVFPGRGADPAIRRRVRHAGGPRRRRARGVRGAGTRARPLQSRGALAHAARPARHARRGLRRLHRDARQDRARRGPADAARGG